MDKKKTLRWIEALRTHPGTTTRNEELISAAKIIQGTHKSKDSGDFNTSKYRRYDEGRENVQRLGEHQSHIAQHIDYFLSKHGAKTRTSVYQKWIFFNNARLAFAFYLDAMDINPIFAAKRRRRMTKNWVKIRKVDELDSERVNLLINCHIDQELSLSGLRISCVSELESQIEKQKKAQEGSGIQPSELLPFQ